MLFSKTLLVLLLAILGTSWVPVGRTNGLASACSSSVKRPDQCVTKGSTTDALTIDDIPQEDDKFEPLTVGIWAANKFYRLPNAPFYLLEIKQKQGKGQTSARITNTFYKEEPVIIKS